MNEARQTLYEQHEKIYDKIDSMIDSLDTSKHNINEIKRYYVYFKAKRLSKLRVVKTYYMFKVLLRYVDFDLSKDSKDKMLVAWNKILDNGYSESYQEDFYELINDLYEVLYDYERILPKFKRKRHLERKQEVITFDEVLKLINLAQNSRDKALIALAFESCCRPSEYLLLKYGDVKEFDQGFEFLVEGKTGVRRIFLFQFIDYVSKWLQDHPTKKDDDWLFVNIHASYGKRLELVSANKILKTLMKRAEINKKSNLYRLRHAGITYSRGVLRLSNRTLEEKAGWVRGSNQYAVYDKSSAFHVKDDIMRALGKIPKEQDIPKGSMICWRCKEINGVAEKYCKRCATSLKNIKVINQHKLSKAILTFFEDPDIQKIILEKHGYDLKELFEDETGKT